MAHTQTKAKPTLLQAALPHTLFLSPPANYKKQPILSLG